MLVLEVSSRLREQWLWGEKAILDALELLLGWRPSRWWLYDWRREERDHRVPVERLAGTGRLYASRERLHRWHQALIPKK